MRRFVAVLLLVTTAACGVSTQQEVQMGQQYSAQINAQLPIVTDPEVERYINVLGDSVARLADDRMLDWRFYVVDSREVNAFAVPGGFVYVNRGLIERFTEMSQLAGVLGHEIGHVTKRHSIQQMEKAQKMQGGLQLVCILTPQVCQSDVAAAGIQLAGGALFAKFSRKDEQEADEEGVKNVIRAGIDPNGLPESFEILLEERRRRPEGVEAWFLTHPLEEDRITFTRGIIGKYDPQILEGLAQDSRNFQAFKARLQSLSASASAAAKAVANRIRAPEASTSGKAPAVALTIAGSDSGGGAGIQADLKTFQRFGVFGTSAITAITAQNTLGVRSWTAVDASLVRDQIDAVAVDLRPGAVKSGMLADASIVRAVASALREHDLRPYVLDPVMVASSGDPLLEPDAVAEIVRSLLPLADLVTPNLDEAEMLIGTPVRDVPAMEKAARLLVERFGARAALVKGGHLGGATVSDVLFDGATRVHETERLGGGDRHGTGCTLSAAITAGLASGHELRESVERALAFVHRAIASAPALGAGHSPLNHFA